MTVIWIFRFPYLEYVYPGVKEISKKMGGRLIKSHLPLSLLPEGVMDRKAKVRKKLFNKNAF